MDTFGSANLLSKGVNQNNLNYSTCTVSDVAEKWSKELLKSGVLEPLRSVEQIIAHVLEQNMFDVSENRNTILNSCHVNRIDDMCYQRSQRVPIEYITERMDFRNLTLKMSRPVFIPWAETVKLVDIVLDELNGRNINKALEFCSGSGAICLALLQERPQLRMTTIDKSELACNLTKENAILNKLSDRLEIIHAEITPDFDSNIISEKYDVIVSNPPYVPVQEFDNLELEITLYNDRAAFNGGTDGMSMIERVLKASSPLLNDGGKLFLEVHPTEPLLIKAFLEKNKHLGLGFVRSFKDFRDEDRYVEIKKEK